MRLSRKSGLLSCVVKWIKYACDYTYELYVEEDTTFTREETSSLQPLRGYTSYSIEYDYTEKRGYYVPAGEYKYNISQMLWNVSSDGMTVTGKEAVWYADGTYGLETRVNRILGTHERHTCKIGAEIDTVRAAKGKLPDKNNGYTYVTTQGEYTIMTDGNGNYYAYELAPRPEPAKFSAKIENDVLVVRGNGVATIENGILYVR